MDKEMGILAGKLVNDLELLQRHLLMLKLVAENEPIGIIKLSEMLKLPQHKVRYSLRLLEQDGLLEATNAGAKITDRLIPFLQNLGQQMDSMASSIKNIQKAVEEVRSARARK